MTASTSSKVPSLSSARAVFFSEYSELVYIPRSDDRKKSTVWYSSKDRHSFRQTLIEDVRRVSQEIHNLPLGGLMSQEQMCYCLGVEAYLSGLAAARQAEQSRRANVAAVLSEQRRQKHEGICDIERLSSVSMSGSEWSSTKARKLAAGYAAVMID